MSSSPIPDRFRLPSQDAAEVTRLAAATRLPRAIAALLLGCGCDTPEAVTAFLAPTLEDLHDPRLMAGMDAALERLRAALLAGEPILIYGDYDVDGTVATVLLKTALERAARFLGTTARVRYHIPHRLREGYGMHEAQIRTAAAEGVRLVISVDTGIRAFAAATEAAHLGMDLIVTDHHLPDAAMGLPAAVAVLNPNQPGCAYPCKQLCGAGVAFKLAQALLENTVADELQRRRLRDLTLPSFLKLLAVATIADAVPLCGENRVIAVLGLRELSRPVQPGLRRLMEKAGIDLGRPVAADDVGFRLAPRINAAGRMDVASDVVELFLSQDPHVAHLLADKLHALNDDRRATEARALTEIEARLAAMESSGTGLASCLVLDDTAASPWHRGVLGILASRVVDRTGRPALVLTHEGGEAHGSGRSVPGFHLLDALSAAHTTDPAEPLFLRFGGHAHAAGFALPSERVSLLRERLLLSAAVWSAQPVETALPCAAQVDLVELDEAFLAAYTQLAPFGQGNPAPVLLARGLRLCDPPRVLKERHLALRVTGEGASRPWRAVAWSRRIAWTERFRTEGWKPGMRFSLAFRLVHNRHPECGGWELQVEDLLPDPTVATPVPVDL